MQGIFNSIAERFLEECPKCIDEEISKEFTEIMLDKSWNAKAIGKKFSKKFAKKNPRDITELITKGVAKKILKEIAGGFGG